MALLAKFNKGERLDKRLVLKIEEFFDFYWSNNPLMAFHE